ncbi:MAG: phage holin family protein [Marinilabiliaceae bacterium]|nr:phage holin family protein [Marinilabiliaceae bacterium]
MSHTIIDDVNELKNAAKDYTDAQIHYFKLQIVENLSSLFSGMIFKIILTLLSLFAALLCSMALSFYLGNIFNNIALGFLAGGSVFLVLIGVLFVIKKNIIEKPIIESLIDLFFPPKPNTKTDE